MIIPDEVEIDPPTLICLAVHWPYEGDANRNAAVAVRYRPEADETAAWRDALPLWRINPENLNGDDHAPKDLHTAFAGSIFDLEPGTAYAIELNLTDPDGGSITRIVTSTTRPVPAVPDGMRVIDVAPGTLAQALKNAQPGDLLLLQEGVHSGPHYAALQAAADKPIVVRGVDRDKVFIEAGGGDHVAMRAERSAYVWFEDLTFRKCGEAIRFHSATGTVIRRCHTIGASMGFRCTVPMARDAYIADNVLEGPCTWPAPEGKIEGEEAIEVIGTGHVVCYNRIVGFGDAISIFRNPAVSIDFYGNDIEIGTDDGIEMDYTDRNTRCFRNRITNGRTGISLQPVYGGPCYVFRNEIYNTQYTQFKLHNGPTGGLLFHNTSVKYGTPLIIWSGAQVADFSIRNNIHIGTDDRLSNWTSAIVNLDMDYNGYGPGKGLFKIGNVWHKSMQDGARDARLEAHGVLLDPPFFSHEVVINEDTAIRAMPENFDLNPSSGAIDAGAILPNINDGFIGKAPDLGARELGAPAPHYGPRN